MAEQSVVSALRRLNPHPSAYAFRRINQATGKPEFPHVFEAPPEELYLRHARGDVMIGGVASTPEDTTTVVGLDVDAHTSDQQPDAAVRRFVSTAAALQVPVIVHRSKSGKGFHVRTLFTGPVKTEVARCIYLVIVSTASLQHDKAVDKVWPPRSGTGVLALPYHSRSAKDTGGTLAVDTQTLEQLPKDWQLPAVLDAHELTPEDCDSLLKTVGLESNLERKMFAGCPVEEHQARTKDGSDGGLQFMLEYCYAAKRLRNTPTEVSYEFWFSMMTNFKPFEGGYQIFDALSALDFARYPTANIMAHWKSIRGGPRLCDNLDPGWTCPARNVCAAKAPAGLPFALKRQGRAF